MTTTIEKLRDLTVEQLLILSNELCQTTVPEDALIREVIKDTQLDTLTPGLAFIGLAGHLHVEMAERLKLLTSTGQISSPDDTLERLNPKGKMIL